MEGEPQWLRNVVSLPTLRRQPALLESPIRQPDFMFHQYEIWSRVAYYQDWSKRPYAILNVRPR